MQSVYSTEELSVGAEKHVLGVGDERENGIRFIIWVSAAVAVRRGVMRLLPGTRPTLESHAEVRSRSDRRKGLKSRHLSSKG